MIMKSLALLPLLALQAAAVQLRYIGKVVDYTNDCLKPLQDADKDSDNFISRSEYISYVQHYSSDPVFDVKQFHQLHITLIQEYTESTCSGYCIHFGTDPNCLNSCAEGIPLKPPAGYDDFRLRGYLYSVCTSTIDKVKNIVDFTEAPSTSVTSAPSPQPTVLVNANLKFGVANLLNKTALDFAEDTGSEGSIQTIFTPALEQLQSKVESNLFVQRLGGERLLQLARYLEIKSRDVKIDMIGDDSCPKAIRDKYPTANCCVWDGIMTFSNGDMNIPSERIIEGAQDRAQMYIEDGDLMSFMPESAQEDYIIYAIEDNTSGRTLPIAAIVGVAAGAVLVGLLAGRALVVNRRRNGSVILDDNDSAEFQPYTLKGLNEEDIEANQVDKGASVVTGTYEANIDRDLSVGESDSDIGSSGWSSSAGMSSLNTGASVDSNEYFQSSLAAIGAASNVHKKFMATNPTPIYPVPARGSDDSSQSDASEKMSPGRKQRQTVSKDVLTKQIEDGDWAAVGATAALLANDSGSTAGSVSSGMSSEFSASSSGVSSGLSSSLSGTSRDRARVAELDRLVDAGNWEGVVLAAAKFEAESDRDAKSVGSASGKNSYKSATERSFFSVASPSVSTNVSDTLKRAEIRAEVEGLVRRVVPEEIDNVDEMMMQFQGREEELVETLRTMQERTIAARQREASRRNAKREAKKLAKETKKANVKIAKSENETKSLIAGEESVVENQLDTLNKAVGVGEWEAVGDTAQQLGESSGSSVGTSDFDTAVSENELDTTAFHSVQSRPESQLGDSVGESDFGSPGQLSEDEEIFKEIDSSTGSTKWKMPFVQKVGDLNLKDLSEEEEARAEAEKWASIAEEAKGNTSNPLASEAADWAIAQSLKKQIQESTDKKVEETESVDSENDDGSV